MDELTLDGKIYLSSKRAAQLTGYAKDYVGQLCREGRVEARLVGRNWYVLETSIREHRFGGETLKKETVDTQQAPKNEVLESWKGTQYLPEPSKELELIEVEPKPAHKHLNLIDTDSSESNNSTSPVVQEMQNAWYDWFSRTNGVTVSKETLLEDEKTIEEREHHVVAPHIEEKIEEPVTPIVIARIVEPVPQPIPEAIKSFQDYKPEEIVPIRRTADPKPLISIQNVPAAVKIPSQQGSIASERLILRKKKPSIVLRTLLIAIGGIVIAVTALGSGQLDSLVGTSLQNVAPLHYLAGESSFDKPSK